MIRFRPRRPFRIPAGPFRRPVRLSAGSRYPDGFTRDSPFPAGLWTHLRAENGREEEEEEEEEEETSGREGSEDHPCLLPGRAPEKMRRVRVKDRLRGGEREGGKREERERERERERELPLSVFVNARPSPVRKGKAGWWGGHAAGLHRPPRYQKKKPQSEAPRKTGSPEGLPAVYKGGIPRRGKAFRDAFTPARPHGTAPPRGPLSSHSPPRSARNRPCRVPAERPCNCPVRTGWPPARPRESGLACRDGSDSGWPSARLRDRHPCCFWPRATNGGACHG